MDSILNESDKENVQNGKVFRWDIFTVEYNVELLLDKILLKEHHEKEMLANIVELVFSKLKSLNE